MKIFELHIFRRLLIICCLMMSLSLQQQINAQTRIPREVHFGVIGGANLSQYSFLPTVTQKMMQGVTREIQAKGEEFNTDFHEAVTHFPAQKEEDKGKVIDVTEKGYKLKDKVIRYAKVVVGQ